MLGLPKQWIVGIAEANGFVGCAGENLRFRM